MENTNFTTTPILHATLQNDNPILQGFHKNNNPNIELFSGNYQRTQLTNQLEIEIAQKVPIFHIPYFLQ